MVIIMEQNQCEDGSPISVRNPKKVRGSKEILLDDFGVKQKHWILC